jgi:geranylgeranyl diphosphate synthase type I
VKLPTVFEKYRDEINAELKLSLAGRDLPLYDMMRYHLGWIDDNGNSAGDSAGKALRPTSCLLACEAVGGDYHRALPAATAIELVHNYSLIHDDIQDDDRERRHRPTVWSIYGKPQAINVGMAMRLLANAVLLRQTEYDIPLEKQLRIQHLIDDTSLRLIEGQYLDISYENHFDITMADYLEMIEKKTAALIACSFEVGSLLGTDDEQITGHIRDIGKNLGLAFQIKDDILGIWDNAGKTGKPFGNDIRHGKKTLPIVYILEKAGDGLREELISVYRNGTINNDGVVAVLRILESVDVQLQAQKMVERYCHEALEAIDKLALVPSAKYDLEEMARFLIERNF